MKYPKIMDHDNAKDWIQDNYPEWFDMICRNDDRIDINTILDLMTEYMVDNLTN